MDKYITPNVIWIIGIVITAVVYILTREEAVKVALVSQLAYVVGKTKNAS